MTMTPSTPTASFDEQLAEHETAIDQLLDDLAATLDRLDAHLEVVKVESVRQAVARVRDIDRACLALVEAQLAWHTRSPR